MKNTVTLEQIQSKIKGEVYLVLPDGKSTLCILTLENGYTIKGISACVDAANFDMNIGRKIAFEDAMRQIWPLEGYLLAERLRCDKAAPVVTNPPNTRKRTPKAHDPEAPWGRKKDGTPKKRPGRAAKETA